MRRIWPGGGQFDIKRPWGSVLPQIRPPPHRSAVAATRRPPPPDPLVFSGGRPWRSDAASIHLFSPRPSPPPPRLLAHQILDDIGSGGRGGKEVAVGGDKVVTRAFLHLGIDVGDRKTSIWPRWILLISEGLKLMWILLLLRWNLL
uniref:Uncharacterized protein n=1 Tax=Leersia perrieri TaxID=77586 RepID=A0A0D9VKG7_9ORYZ